MATIPSLPLNGQQLHDTLTALNEEIPNTAGIAAAVEAYLTENPPADGADASPAQIAAAVEAYLVENPPANGEDGATPDIQTFATYSEALAYSTANPDAIVFSEEEAP